LTLSHSWQKIPTDSSKHTFAARPAIARPAQNIPDFRESLEELDAQIARLKRASSLARERGLNEIAQAAEGELAFAIRMREALMTAAI
jgi:hypothetical protein